MTTNDSYDCVVIGGGPAGATVGTILADYGHQVLILEQSEFPRNHIGESLMPQTYDTFKRLGVLDQLKKSNYPVKESVQFVSSSGKDSQPYYFTDRDPSERSVTWQVPRDHFDQMMLDNAKAHGVKVRQGVRVGEVVFEGDRAVGVKIVNGDRVSEIPAKVVVDATGMSTLLASQLNIRDDHPDLKNGSIYSYYKNAVRDEGRNAGATIIVHTANKKGWFWFIPLPDNMTSVGVVAEPAYLFTGRGNDPLTILDEEIAGCPGLQRRLEGAQRMSGGHVIRNFSYKSKRVAGDGWVMVGDAFGFLDPIYSSGVFLALKSGEFAADAIHEALVAGDVSAERLGCFGKKLAAGMDQIQQLIYAFYDEGFSFAKFNRDHPEFHDHIVRLLIGDVFNDEVGEVFQVLKDWVKLPAPIHFDGSSSS